MTSGRYADELEARAAEVLPEPVWRYLRQGARDSRSADEAQAAWHRFRFRPRVLHDVTDIDLGTSLLGGRAALPVGVAPSTFQRAAHRDGELGMARAAAASGAVMVLSSNASVRFEEVAGTGVAWWLQLYVTQDRSVSSPLLQRAVRAGARSIVLTADTPVVGTKYDDGPTVWEATDPSWVRANFGPVEHDGDSDRPHPADAEKATDLGPADVDWLATTTGLPVVVKGVLRADDARRCVDAGAAAVWVSNHGGRQLDGVTATADCLAEVVGAVAGRADVYVDGGVRSAREVCTALALGANAVFLGRQAMYALAVDGQAGVERLLGEVGAELRETLRLLGCRDLAALDPSVVDRT